MNSIDLSNIKKVSSDYQNMSSNLSQCFKGQWDDSVRDSFANYNKQIEHSSDCITRIYNSTKLIADTSFDNKDLIELADMVISEVESL